MNELPGAAREAFLMKALPKGLRDCQCSSVDLDGLEFLILRSLGAPERDYGMIAPSPPPSCQKTRP